MTEERGWKRYDVARRKAERKYKALHPDVARRAEQKYRHNHPEWWAMVALRSRIRTKRRAINALGGCCVICGQTDLRILTINHLNGDGNAERLAFRAAHKGANPDGIYLYRAINSGRRGLESLDVRCYNCNILYEYEIGRRQWIKEPIE